MRSLMRERVVFDDWNLNEPRTMTEYGLVYYAIGRWKPSPTLLSESRAE